MAEPLPLRRSDYLILVGFMAFVFAVPLLVGRILGNHETIHAQNLREMRSDGDWIIPHCGGRPWLERPPLPFWLTMPTVTVFGDSPLVLRAFSVVVALPVVLLTAWMAGLWFGRGIGLLAGGVLATMQEFFRYALAPESDIFVCALVAVGMALFVHLEFQRPREGESTSFVGPRPWAVLILFVVLGLGNLVKGLLFADVFLLVPFALFLLVSPTRWGDVRRYVWLPGWLAFLVIGGSWAIAAYLRHPDIVALWRSDYAGRIGRAYMTEPAWYYLAHLPVNLLPWTPLALAGLWLTRREALGQPRSPERLLWCWAVLPVVVLSIPHGKHHHYLLAVTAPWAILAAVGAVRTYGALAEQARRLSFVATLAILVVVVEVGVGLAAAHWPRLGPWLPALLAAPPLVAGTVLLSLRLADPVRALPLVLAVTAVGYWGKEWIDARAQEGSRRDLELIAEAIRRVPVGQRVLVLDCVGPLDPSWSLYHLGERGRMLHNMSFLRQEDLGEGELHVISRPFLMGGIEEYGSCEQVAQSSVSRGVKKPEERLTLYRVRLAAGLARVRGPVYVSPMQATGRDVGPELR